MAAAHVAPASKLALLAANDGRRAALAFRPALLAAIQPFNFSTFQPFNLATESAPRVTGAA